MTNGRGMIGRLLRLEQAAPDSGEVAAFRERIMRARARVEASLTPEERAYRATLAYAAEQQAIIQRCVAALPAGSPFRQRLAK